MLVSLNKLSLTKLKGLKVGATLEVTLPYGATAEVQRSGSQSFGVTIPGREWGAYISPESVLANLTAFHSDADGPILE